MALSALLWLWWFLAIFPDQSPFGMHPPCPALSGLLIPGTRSLQLCPFAACLLSFPVSVFFQCCFFGWCDQRTSSSSPSYSLSTSKRTESSPTPICSFSSPSKTLWAVFDNTAVRLHQYACYYHLSSPVCCLLQKYVNSASLLFRRGEVCPYLKYIGHAADGYNYF